MCLGVDGHFFESSATRLLTPRMSLHAVWQPEEEAQTGRSRQPLVVSLHASRCPSRVAKHPADVWDTEGKVTKNLSNFSTAVNPDSCQHLATDTHGRKSVKCLHHCLCNGTRMRTRQRVLNRQNPSWQQAAPSWRGCSELLRHGKLD